MSRFRSLKVVRIPSESTNSRVLYYKAINLIAILNLTFNIPLSKLNLYNLNSVEVKDSFFKLKSKKKFVGHFQDFEKQASDIQCK